MADHMTVVGGGVYDPDFDENMKFGVKFHWEF